MHSSILLNHFLTSQEVKFSLYSCHYLFMVVITMPNKLISYSLFFSSPLLMTLATLSAFFFYLVGVRIFGDRKDWEFCTFSLGALQDSHGFSKWLKMLILQIVVEMLTYKSTSVFSLLCVILWCARSTTTSLYVLCLVIHLSSVQVWACIALSIIRHITSIRDD